MEASRAADYYGCAPGHVLHVADAEQAYVQAPMKGTPTWVAIPDEAIPPHLRAKYKSMKRPVCRMIYSLYGHPDAGTNWEEFADEGIRRAGFTQISKDWPSCY